jgi:very-short-patch-repair endonuclease/predicted nucleic acid-binding Zn ribbon protein
MAKKSSAPKATKFPQEEDGLKPEISYPVMNCKWCDTLLNKSQIHEFLRGKAKGTACSRKCSMLLNHYKDKSKYFPPINGYKAFQHVCEHCSTDFFSAVKDGRFCSNKCAGTLSSKRMKENNPMSNEETRGKVSKTLKAIRHKPLAQGGNGRGATIQQLKLYNELIKQDNSFEMELIESTIPYTNQFKAPKHYKIDIGSRIHMLAIEVDGVSHNSLKVRECDNRKDKLLALKGWKVLRLLNSQIDKELQSCVQMVLSTI